MKAKTRSLFFVMPLLANSFCYSQNNKPGDIISLAKNIISKPVSSLKDSISCADAGINGKPVPVDSCRTLYYFPADSSFFYLGKKKVTIIFLFIDSIRKIDAINYFITYTTDEVAMNSRGFAKDYDALKKYFDDLFQLEGISKKVYRDEYYVTTGFSWNAYNFTFFLEKTVFPKRGNRKKFASTQVYIEKMKGQ
jgi:hypothetical protein